MTGRSRTPGPATVVLAAVVGQGVGNSVVGNSVTPRLSVCVVFIAFALAAIVGCITRACGQSSTGRASRRDVFLINVYSAGAFGLFYVSTTMALPTAMTVVETSMAPVVLGLMALSRTRTGRRRHSALAAYVIAVGSAMVVAVVADSHRGDAILGCTMAAIAGGCALGVLTTTTRMTRHGATTAYVNSVRFHGCWATAAALLVARPGGVPTDLHAGVALVLTSALCVTVPIVALQYGIARAPIHVSAGLISALPAVVLATDAGFGAADILATGPVAAATVASVLATRAQLRTRREEPGRPRVDDSAGSR
ncbi:hypothetical protein ACQ7HM_14650 [Williamsia sp. MIQD14]|uniref:hypothetical protein n=1 Tax=Williamsia sp. MIQD14 TaxID=3425703 RepID=UPI003DA077D2